MTTVQDAAVYLLQIRRGYRNNLGIINNISSWKHILLPIIRTVETVQMWGHHVFIEKYEKKYLWIILNTPSYLELWIVS